MNYVLGKNGMPIEEPDRKKWGKWLQTAERKIDTTEVDGIEISTVFLGFDHSLYGYAPVLFETMIFGGKHDQYQDRYCTKAEAIAGHSKAVNLVKGAL